MIDRWPRIASKPVLITPIYEIRRDTRENPRGGTHEFYVMESVNWVNVIPVTADGEVVMVRQPRFGIEATTLEIPGGLVDREDRTPRDAAARELLEETGYAPDSLEEIGAVHPNPAIQNNRQFHFHARRCRRIAAPRPDDSEDLEVVLVPLPEIPQRIAQGEITHSLVVSAFFHLFARHGFPRGP